MWIISPSLNPFCNTQYMGLQFDLPSRTQITPIAFESYYTGCFKCHCKIYAVQHTAYKKVQELGTPYIKNIHELESKTVKCSRCGWQGTPEHPYYPKDYTVTLGVIAYALKAALGTDNHSAKAIAAQLHTQLHVDIDEKTVQKWIDHHQDPFLASLGCIWDNPTTKTALLPAPFCPSSKLDPPPFPDPKSLRTRLRATLQAKISQKSDQRKNPPLQFSS